MNIKNLLLSGALALGVFVGAVQVAGAITGDDSLQQSDRRIDIDPAPIVFSPTSGSERSLFSASVTKPSESDVVAPFSSTDAQECVAINLDDGEATLCFDRPTIASGLAYGLLGREDGGYLVVGVVPDDVDTVEIGGQKVEISGNFWYRELDDDAPRDLRVGDSRTGTFATLPAADVDR